MKYKVVEPHKFDVLGTFDTELEADHFASKDLMNGWNDRLACVFTRDNDDRKCYSEAKPNKIYRIKLGHFEWDILSRNEQP